jgi:hypothetical protein
MAKAASSSKPAKVYQLKITLDNIRPPVWRRVLVPANMPLSELHYVIQVAMGWTDSHMHAFEIGQTYYGVPDIEFDDDMENEHRIKLSQIAPSEKSKFRYEYDFGDSWRHSILVEKILPAEPGIDYPVCLVGKRSCPPEDCGGAWGYAGLLGAISDPEHEEHEDTLEWLGDDFDPEAFDMDTVNVRLRGMSGSK